MEHFGWTYDYLVNGISWALVKRMMLDAPSYDLDGKDDEKEIVLTEEKEIMNYINNLM
ncbi:hypothetical protein FACS189432_05050 [Bacteroidia bacterium]|nr:hypothetical protein FACS189426_06720 [Bacteroidia bacterium]GHT27876.1 hypothetical protein FACS189432_05050 [Bacteroidia bacterium]